MKNKKTKISPHELSELSGRFPSVTVNEEYDFVYENQIPIGGIILLEGEALLTKKNKVKDVLESGTIFGFEELLRDIPVKLGCKLRENSRFIILHRSDIKAILEEKKSSIMRQILSI